MKLRTKLILLALLSLLCTAALSPVAPAWSHSPVTPYGVAFTPHEHHLSRGEIIALIWPDDNPIDDPGKFPANVIQTYPGEWRIDYEPTEPALSSRFRLWQAAPQIGNCWVIYHEGHTLLTGRLPDGLATVDYFVNRGCNVVYMDMPLQGVNAADQTTELVKHDSFGGYNWQRDYHPLSLFLEPPAHVVDLIYQQTTGEPYIIMVGRSGGGWTTLWYSALDPRIDATVIVAGFWPQSLRGRPQPSGVIKHGDFEQSTPGIYDYVSYEDLVNLLSTRRVIAFYGSLDPCCFNLSPTDPYVAWLGDRIDVYIDADWNQHGLSGEEYDVLTDWLNQETGRAWLPVVRR